MSGERPARLARIGLRWPPGTAFLSAVASRLGLEVLWEANGNNF